MANKSDITELLQEALDKVYEASESLRSAQKLMKEESYSYNITGNMDSYVINYLTGGVDCIADKIEKYIDETNELDSDEDDDDDDDDDFVNDAERDAFFQREMDERDMPGGFND